MTVCERCGCDSPRVKMQNGLCVSTAQCSKRRIARVGVRLELADPPAHRLADSQADVEREVRRQLYIHGLCVGCGRPQSPGRPRCEVCHAIPQVVRILLQA